MDWSQPFCSPNQAKGTYPDHRDHTKCFTMKKGLSQHSAGRIVPSSILLGMEEQPSRTPWPGVTESLLGDLEAAATTVIHGL